MRLNSSTVKCRKGEFNEWKRGKVGILRGQLRGAISGFRLWRLALVVMAVRARWVIMPCLVIILRRRNGSLLEEMMHPMGSGVENKKEERSGDRDAGLAAVFTRQYADQRRHERRTGVNITHKPMIVQQLDVSLLRRSPRAAAGK